MLRKMGTEHSSACTCCWSGAGVQRERFRRNPGIIEAQTCVCPGLGKYLGLARLAPQPKPQKLAAGLY